MKRTLMYGMAALAFTLGACGGKKEVKGEEVISSEAVAAEAPAAVDVIAQGEALVKASDCKTCHLKDGKLVGPAHLEVAKKYEFTEANVAMLADKIVKGGTGVWGELPMSPHPTVSVDDAKKMARYVLSLDGEKEH